MCDRKTWKVLNQYFTKDKVLLECFLSRVLIVIFHIILTCIMLSDRVNV